jgi:hypothetical protein
LFRYRLAAGLVLSKWLVLLAALGFVGYSVVTSEREQVHFSLWLLGAALLMLVCQWVVAARCRCPLCLGPPLARKDCVKHRGATRLFGSYRLRVAHSIIWQGCFRCPYCGETTVMEVRQRKRQGGYRR